MKRLLKKRSRFPLLCLAQQEADSKLRINIQKIATTSQSDGVKIEIGLESRLQISILKKMSSSRPCFNSKWGSWKEIGLNWEHLS